MSFVVRRIETTKAPSQTFRSPIDGLDALHAATVSYDADRATGDGRVSALATQWLVIDAAIDRQIGNDDVLKSGNWGLLVGRRDRHTNSVVMLLDESSIDFQDAQHRPVAA